MTQDRARGHAGRACEGEREPCGEGSRGVSCARRVKVSVLGDGLARDVGHVARELAQRHIPPNRSSCSAVRTSVASRAGPGGCSSALDNAGWRSSGQACSASSRAAENRRACGFRSPPVNRRRGCQQAMAAVPPSLVAAGRLLQGLAQRDHPVDGGLERRPVKGSAGVVGGQFTGGLLALSDALCGAEHQVHSGQCRAQRAVLG